MPSGDIIGARFFDQPGFDTLVDTWQDVFRLDPDKLDPADAIKATINTRNVLQEQFGYDRETLTVLENIACRYARDSLAAIEEATRIDIGDI